MCLDHVMMLDHLERTCGPIILGEVCLLWNSKHISQEDALRVLESGGYSPYVIVIPQANYDGVFKNMDVGSVSV